MKTIWRRAAEMSEEKLWGACDSLQEIGIGSPSQFRGNVPEILQFREWFKPDGLRLYWWDFSDEGMNARVLALLFMEQIEADQ